MPVQDLNQLFAAPWPGLQDQFRNELTAMLQSFNIDKQSGKGDLLQYHARVGLSNPEVTWGLNEPPGFVDSTDELLTLAVPLFEGGWSLTISCQLNGSLMVSGAGIRFFDYAIVNQPQTINVKMFRLTGEIGAKSFSAPMPQLSSLDVKPDISIELTGFISCQLDVDSAQVSRRPDGSIEVLIAFEGIEIQAVKSIRLSGKATINVAQNLSVDLDATVDVDGLTLPIKMSHKFPLPGPAIAVLSLAQQPRDWGRGRPQTIDTIPSWANFPATASAIESAIQEHAPFGATFDLIFPNGFKPCTPGPHQPSNYYGEDDSAIWTGHYLAAEAFRYAAAKKNANVAEQQEAITRAGIILDGIDTLLSIPEAATLSVAGEAGKLTGLPCRAALPCDWPVETQEPLNNPAPTDKSKYYEHVTISGKAWCALGRDSDPPSRDSYSGLFLGLGCAFRLIEDATTQGRVKSLVVNLLTYLLDSGWNVPTPTGDSIAVGGHGEVETTIITSFIFQFHQQLAFLCVGNSVAPDLFGAQFEQAAKAADLIWIPVCGDCLDPVGKYYKFNLDYASLGLLVLLDTDNGRQALYLRVFRMMRAAIGHHLNAYFNMWWIIANPDAKDAQAEGSVLGVTLEQETVYLLYDWLWRPLRVPGPNCCLYRKETPSVFYQTHLNPATDIGLYTELGASKPDVLSTFPLPVRYRPGQDMDFCWQRAPFLSGFNLGANGEPDFSHVDLGQPEQESPGIDFLLPYYMARYIGIV
jgi:hypothetical protein